MRLHCFFYRGIVMNTFPTDKGKKSRAIDLKTPVYRSHNRDSEHERIKALVRFLARRAAVEDHRMVQDALAHPDNKNSGD